VAQKIKHSQADLPPPPPHTSYISPPFTYVVQCDRYHCIQQIIQLIVIIQVVVLWYSDTEVTEDNAASIFRVKSVGLGNGHRHITGSIRGGRVLSEPNAELPSGSTGNGGGQCPLHSQCGTKDRCVSVGDSKKGQGRGRSNQEGEVTYL
jgi:hypothetical protein